MRLANTPPSAAALAALTLLVATACEPNSSTAPPLDAADISASSAGPVVMSATGSGHGIYTFSQGTGRRTFAFNARKYADGSVGGEIQVHNQVAENGLHGQVICMVELGEGIVGMGARVTTYGSYLEASLPNLSGDYAVFAVRDNGEGAGAPPDQFTSLDITGSDPSVFGGANLALLACANPLALGFTTAVVESFMLELQDGNIQVRR